MLTLKHSKQSWAIDWCYSFCLKPQLSVLPNFLCINISDKDDSHSQTHFPQYTTCPRIKQLLMKWLNEERNKELSLNMMTLHSGKEPWQKCNYNSVKLCGFLLKRSRKPVSTAGRASIPFKGQCLQRGTERPQTQISFACKQMSWIIISHLKCYVSCHYNSHQMCRFKRENV